MKIIFFESFKDAEDFGQRHSDKFNVTFQNQSSSDSERFGRAQKKSVSFENDFNESDAPNKTKSILKSNNATNASTAASNNRSSSQFSVRTEPIHTTLGNSASFSDLRNEENNDVLVSTNATKKNKAEGYEILVNIWFYLLI